MQPRFMNALVLLRPFEAGLHGLRGRQLIFAISSLSFKGAILMVEHKVFLRLKRQLRSLWQLRPQLPQRLQRPYRRGGRAGGLVEFKPYWYDSSLLHSNFQSWQMRSLPTLDPYVYYYQRPQPYPYDYMRGTYIVSTKRRSYVDRSSIVFIGDLFAVRNYIS